MTLLKLAVVIFAALMLLAGTSFDDLGVELDVFATFAWISGDAGSQS